MLIQSVELLITILTASKKKYCLLISCTYTIYFIQGYQTHDCLVGVKMHFLPSRIFPTKLNLHICGAKSSCKLDRECAKIPLCRQEKSVSKKILPAPRQLMLGPILGSVTRTHNNFSCSPYFIMYMNDRVSHLRRARLAGISLLLVRL